MIWAGIFGVEGEYDDYLTTTTAFVKSDRK